MRKIINDPVYGFITIDNLLLFAIIDHPYYQRLRRIHQLALAYLVYPGATHTRLHHSLGAYHLMCLALDELKQKGIYISYEEEIATKAAILLHDIGHGPFSHSLEQTILPNIGHEKMSQCLMEDLNNNLNGQLSLAIEIFMDKYHKKFLHQLVSSQLDVDRMDYLNRDSFYTGVSDGIIGYNRIIKMLTVSQGNLAVEEKGIYSVEKFLIARRFMYWQVYLHKTVLVAEKMLIKIIERVKSLHGQNITGLTIGTPLDTFLFNTPTQIDKNTLDLFCQLDDSDIIIALKKWSCHKDNLLSSLSKRLINRQLMKITLFDSPIEAQQIENKINQTASTLNIPSEEAKNYVWTGEAINTTYQSNDIQINILFKDKSLKGISEVSNTLIHQSLLTPVKKFYICSLT